MKHHFLVPSESPADVPGGIPDLRDLTAADLDRLLTETVAAQRAAWEAIAQDPSEPTFATVVVPLEQAEAEADRGFSIVSTCESSMGTPEILEMAERWAPALSEHATAAARNAALAARLEAVPDEGLSPEESHLLDEWRKSFEAQGAFVPEEKRAALGAIEAELASLSAEYSASLLDGSAAASFITDSEEHLEGLSEAQRQRAARAAAAAGREGSWLFKPDLFCVPAILSSMANAEARRAFYAHSINRGRGPVRDSGSAETPENLTIGARMAALRDERAAVFGAAHHAELTLRRSVAGTPERALALIEPLVPKALANFERELDVMAAVADVSRAEIQAADVPFLLARVAHERHSVDEEALTPYFELNRVLTDGVFFAATALYGITFEERVDAPGCLEGVRTWVVREVDGSHLGVFIGDFFARDTKQGGAWMHTIVPQNGLDGTRPIVLNTLNIAPPSPGEPALLTLDNVRTLFHEFGHALHGLPTRTGFVTNSGTNVPRDFVEYPSQVNEMWMLAPGVVENYALHVKTSESLPAQAIAALRASAQWGEGFRTSEYLGAALLDMAWHTRGVDAEPITTPEAARAFEESVLARYDFDRLPVSPRYRTGNFKHIFGGGYAAGYYSYIFSELMDAETVAWFEARGGLTRANGEAFRRTLLETGNRQDPAQSFRDLLGRDPDVGPLLTRRGLL
jgi:peptidyl-dipeptidase Dcp